MFNKEKPCAYRIVELALIQSTEIKKQDKTEKGEKCDS